MLPIPAFLRAFFLPIFCLVIVLFPGRMVAETSFRPVVLIVGTRPEAIKMIPLYQALKAKNIPVCLCSTGQHAELLDDVWTLFGVAPDVELKIMKPGQNLFYLTETLLAKMREVYEKINPSVVVVQGDTTSAMVSALAAFYVNIPVAHVEAGLRTGNIRAPFPEELNRRIITLVASFHFAPTEMAASQLFHEGVRKEMVFCTGNTVVDALYGVINRLNHKTLFPLPELAETIRKQQSEGRKIVLLTAHRRESFFDGGLERIFQAMKRVLLTNPQIFIIFPVHPNPVIRKVLQESHLDTLPNILIMPPLSYHDVIFVMDKAAGVATDSGGISEEGVSLQKPVLILRNETDRPEALKDGNALIVGTDEEKIVSGFEWMIERASRDGVQGFSPFGDGKAGERIAEILQKFLVKEGQ